MLKINNINKVFYKDTINEKIAIDNLSLQLNKNDFVTIIGSNGAGKSTLFNLICGKMLCDSGKIYLADEDITFKKDFLRAKDIGILFQDPRLGTAPNMTIAENLALASGKRGLSIGINKKDRAYFKDELSELGLGLENRLDAKVGLLSGGQRQALSLLMATISVPELLLLDEHTAALDPETANKILTITQKIVKEHHISCMMITHNITNALEVGTRTIMMDGGKIILDIEGEEREKMDLPTLLNMFKKELDNDRMLL